MQLITHPVVIWIRNALRVSGLARPLRMLFSGKGYEEKVDAALLAMVRPGDIAWDVGANVGYYTRKMAERVGASGRVFAFEPSPINFARLKSACDDLHNVECVPNGLSAANCQIRFVQGTDDLGATSRLVGIDEDTVGTVNVEVCCGDSLISSGRVPSPNVMKIDVEGHEHEVLKGLSNALAEPSLRECIVEVHFGILAESGASHAPAQISRTFEAQGFRLRWLDASHLHATRAGVAK